MNKRMNVILNTIEFIAVILISSIMYACYKLSYTEFNNYLIINKTIVTLIVIMEIIIVGIELLLFIFYNKNQKYIYIGYTIIEFVLTALINIYIPFSGLIVLVLFSLIKNVCRQRMITTIYNKKYFNRYCKLFNLKLKTVTVPRKKKKKATTLSSKKIKNYAQA